MSALLWCVCNVCVLCLLCGCDLLLIFCVLPVRLVVLVFVCGVCLCGVSLWFGVCMCVCVYVWCVLWV